MYHSGLLGPLSVGGGGFPVAQDIAKTEPRVLYRIEQDGQYTTYFRFFCENVIACTTETGV